MQYGYDAVGNRIEMVDALGTTAYRYDALSRPTAVVDPFGQRVQYTYDAAGRRTGLKLSDGRQIEYSHDARGQLVEVRDWLGGRNRYAYDAVGNPVEARLANGGGWRATRDPLHRLRELVYVDAAERCAASFAYDYDAQGNIVSAHEVVAGGRATQQSFTYDELNRLVCAAAEDRDARFEYDAVGNRVAVVDCVAGQPAAAVRASYDAADQLVAVANSDGASAVRLEYDGDGRLVERISADGTTHYAWDSAGRLVSLTPPVRPATRYGYDGDGNLLEEQHAARVTRYGLDAVGPLSHILTAEEHGDQHAYVYGIGHIAAFTGDLADYPIVDVRGSVRAHADASGQVGGPTTYDAWGASETVPGLFGFGGERHDAIVGLVNLRARWYEPSSRPIPRTRSVRRVAQQSHQPAPLSVCECESDDAGRSDGMVGSQLLPGDAALE